MRAKLAFAAAAAFSVLLYGPMAAMSISAALVIATSVGIRIFEKPPAAQGVLGTRASRRLFSASAAVAGFCAWSLFWAEWSGLSFFGARPDIHFLQDIAKAWHLFFPFFFSALLSRLSDCQFRRIIWIWLCAGALISVFACVQHYLPLYKASMLPYFNFPDYRPGTGFLDRFNGKYHATGFTGSHLSFASIMAFPFACWLTLLAFLPREKQSRDAWVFGAMRSFAAAGALLTFIANFLTYSKTAWISAPVAVVLIALVGFRGRARIGIIAGLSFSAMLWMSTSIFRLRFQGIDSIIGERVGLWRANWAMVKAHPLFGVGWHHNFDLSYAYYKAMGVEGGFSSHAHNNILDQWATTGLFGALAFVWLSYLLMKVSFEIHRSRLDARTIDGALFRALGLGFFAGWICLHINGITQANFFDAKVLHQIGWVTAISLECARRFNLLKEKGNLSNSKSSGNSVITV